jgi:RimJ/RimL family protein N-acetyltransferase
MKQVLLTDGVASLRPWRDSDLGEAVEICQDAEIVRWTRVPSPYREEDGRQFLEQAQRSFEEGTAYAFAVVESPDGALIGSISVTIVAGGVGEVGYFVRAGLRRKGIGKRAVRLISRWAFEDLGLARLQITVLSGNTASQRLAESSGYLREGVLRSWVEIKGTRVDSVMHSLLPGEIGRLSSNE